MLSLTSCYVHKTTTHYYLSGRLLRCVRCPTAYHVGDLCIAAGSTDLPGYYIVCSKHFLPDKSHKHHSHFNVSWCFICSKGKQYRFIFHQTIHIVDYNYLIMKYNNNSNVEYFVCLNVEWNSNSC